MRHLRAHEAFGAIALAPDFGVGWTTLDPDDDQPTANITLRPEQPIHGRLFDLQGKPVPNVTLTVGSISRIGTNHRLESLLDSMASVFGSPRSMTFRPGPSR